MLLFAMLLITLALVFYSVAVWSEKLQKNLKKWHVIVFWIGFICDATGTMLMGKIAKLQATVGTIVNPFHNITGSIALLLMAFSAVWATIVIIRNNEKMREYFHKFSIFVWLIWLIPYISGMIMGISS